MAHTLDKNQGIGLTPRERFMLWVKLNPDEVARAAAILNKKDIGPEIAAMALWLEGQGKNKKAQKRDWYRFVCNWLRNVAQNQGSAKSGTKYRKPVGSFEGDSGLGSM